MAGVVFKAFLCLSAEQPERSEAASAKQTAEQPDCELCEAARFTHWYFEDEICWIADCEACLVPMVVWKTHGAATSESAVTHMLDRLAAAGRDRFGNDPFDIDRDMRTIPDHWHAHARDRNWFASRMARPLSRYTAVGAKRVERS